MAQILNDKEIMLARLCMDHALKCGARKARITLEKSRMDVCSTLNGEVDKVSSCLDRSMNISLFADGRFGSISTNRLEEGDLKEFVEKAVRMVKMLAEDPCRDLPDPSRTVKDARTGLELGLFDANIDSMTPDTRLTRALGASVFNNGQELSGCTLISEEGELSDSTSDTLIIDSNGLECRHMETSFEYGTEITIEDRDGNRISGYWWDSSPFLAGLDDISCGKTALERAVAQIGPEPIRSGKYTMVLQNECAAKMVSPLMNALGGYSLQQRNSFLLDSLGKKILHEGLVITDDATRKGAGGARLFDSEGVRTSNSPIISNGVIDKYFLNTYMAAKMGLEPTIEGATRPWIHSYLSPSLGTRREGPLDLEAIMGLCSDGILVTGFNGGNSNSATGDFSYGVEGFLFRNGKTVHPVREALVTGNFLKLWNNLLSAGDDPRRCMSKLIPTLAFENVDLN